MHSEYPVKCMGRTPVAKAKTISRKSHRKN
jgi:hypothetical protein